MLHLQSAAEAGCIRADASWTVVRDDSVAFLGEGMGQGASLPPAETTVEVPKRIRFQAKDAVLNPRSSLMDGGASVPIEEQSGGGAFSWATLDPPQCPAIPQVSRARVDGSHWHPPPFSTGVFRPPRT